MSVVNLTVERLRRNPEQLRALRRLALDGHPDAQNLVAKYHRLAADRE